MTPTCRYGHVEGDLQRGSFVALRSRNGGPLPHLRAFLARGCQPAYRGRRVFASFYPQATDFSQWLLTTHLAVLKFRNGTAPPGNIV